MLPIRSTGKYFDGKLNFSNSTFYELVEPTLSVTRPNGRESGEQDMTTSIHEPKINTTPTVRNTKTYLTRSTTSVVKDLIGGGATLVYDSSTQKRPPRSNSNASSHSYSTTVQNQQQRKEHVRIDETLTRIKTNDESDSTNKAFVNLIQEGYLSNASNQNVASISTVSDMKGVRNTGVSQTSNLYLTYLGGRFYRTSSTINIRC